MIRLAEEYGIKVGFIMDLIIREFNPKVGENLIRYALEHFWNNDVCSLLAPKFSKII